MIITFIPNTRTITAIKRGASNTVTHTHHGYIEMLVQRMVAPIASAMPHPSHKQRKYAIRRLNVDQRSHVIANAIS